MGVTDTHRAHVLKTLPSMFDPMWQNAWRVFDDDHLAVFISGHSPLVVIELFGVEDRGALDRLRMETCGVWFEEPVAVESLGQHGISESAWGTALSSRRIAAYKRPAVITENYPDEDHWTVERFKPPMIIPPYSATRKIEMTLDSRTVSQTVMGIRIPKGDNPHLPDSYRDEVALSLKDRPDLLKRLSEGAFGSVLMGPQVAQGFNLNRHVSVERLLPYRGEPLCVGQDGGHTPATVIGQTWRGYLRVLAAFPIEHGGMRQQYEQNVVPWFKHYAPWAVHQDEMIYGVYDPSMPDDESDTDRNPVDVIVELLGGSWNPGPTDWESRRAVMLKSFNMAVAGDPALQIDQTCAKDLVKTLNGRWHYPQDNMGNISRDKPKQPNHPWEDLGQAYCYFLCGVLSDSPKQITQALRADTKFDVFSDDY